MDLSAFLSGDSSAAAPAIRAFVQKKFNLSEIDNWIGMWNATFQYLDDAESVLVQDCLSTLRILSRDKTHMEEVLTDRQIQTLLRLANIDPILATNTTKDEPVIVESLKCLCNLVFNSATCQDLFDRMNGAEGIIRRIRLYRDHAVKYEIQFFDMKLLFLVTALNIRTRTKVRDNLNGVVYLTELIDWIVQEKSSQLPVWFEDREIDLICEILKVLFNLTSNSESDVQQNELQFCRLAGVLRNTLLRTKTTNREKRQDLQSNVVNLLSCLPNASLAELAPLCEVWVCTHNRETDHRLRLAPSLTRETETGLVFEGHEMTALHSFVEFLRTRLDSMPTIGPGVLPSERLGPILTVLIKCSRAHRIQRRYIRSVVLPPLTNVMTRPEEGDELRNVLCRLLTSANTAVRDLVAELLFVICKENVARMAKYAGYGNSMGMFANKGLLGNSKVKPSQEYSSDSEDSDTEEYKRMETGINPVLGCYEPPRPSPFENMSDEQKEYEAMKLLNLIDQLDRQGIIKPARITDGKPEAVDHVLQLLDKEDP